MAKQLITSDARPSKGGILRDYLLREGSILVAALTAFFVIIRLFIPRLVNARNDALLVAAGVAGLAVLVAAIWLAFHVRTQFKTFRRRYLAARDE